MRLETERLILRLWQESDIFSLIQLTKDAGFNSFSSGRYQKMTEKEACLFIDKNLRQFAEKRIGRFGVFSKRLLTPIGICGLFEMGTDPFKGHIAISYRFAEAYWGLGFAQEASAELLRYGLEELGFKEIIALIDPQNSRSVRVAEKLNLVSKGDVIHKGKLLQRWTTNREI